MVALGLIGVVMAALSPFFTTSLAVTNDERGHQVAIQLASDAMERARSLMGAGLFAGRSMPAVQRQWALAPAEVRDTYGAAMLCAWEPSLSADQPAACGSSVGGDGTDPGAQAGLPTVPVETTVAGTAYAQQWFVGYCWQPAGAGASCDASKGTGAGGVADIRFARVVVAVTWSHQSCPGDRCVYLSTTLLSPEPDPVFNTYRLSPILLTPGAQYGYVTEPVSLQVTVKDGYAPLIWTITGLPAGLTHNQGMISGTPAGTTPKTVAVTVVDSEQQTVSGSFTWAVAALPAVTNPGAQTGKKGVAVTALQLPATGGHAPLTWEVTGLPPGLSSATVNGVRQISGTPTTAGAYPVTVKITDSQKRTNSITFTWQVNA
jgi:type II secretory pathway pseudopilin PulG